MRKRKDARFSVARCGSTLIELLLVVSVLVLLSGSLYYIFDQMLKAYARARGSLDFVNNGVVALSKVTEDLERAFLPADPLEDPSNLFFLVGANGSSGAPDHVDFYVVTDRGFEELGYRIENSRLLRRREAQTATHNVPDGVVGGEGSTEEAVAASISDLQVGYHYRTSASGNFTFESATAADTWDSRTDTATNFSKLGLAKNPDGLPDLIEIRLVVRNPKNANETKLFKTLIKIPAAA